MVQKSEGLRSAISEAEIDRLKVRGQICAMS
jgi:hypothetical protein